MISHSGTSVRVFETTITTTTTFSVLKKLCISDSNWIYSLLSVVWYYVNPGRVVVGTQTVLHSPLEENLLAFPHQHPPYMKDSHLPVCLFVGSRFFREHEESSCSMFVSASDSPTRFFITLQLQQKCQKQREFSHNLCITTTSSRKTEIALPSLYLDGQNKYSRSHHQIEYQTAYIVSDGIYCHILNFNCMFVESPFKFKFWEPLPP